MDDVIEVKKQKRRGPKKLSPEDLRTHCVSVWLNDAEVKTLDGLRMGHSKGAFLRMAALTCVIERPSKIHLSTYSELARSAANLNQIAHHLNGGGAADIALISAELAAFRLALLGEQS